MLEIKFDKAIFFAPKFVTQSNGIKVFYEAAYLFSKYLDVEIILFDHGSIAEKPPKKYIKLIKSGIETITQNTVFIYPESLNYDPIPNVLNKKIIRYFLSKPYILNGLNPNYKNDFSISYSKLISSTMPQLFILNPAIKNTSLKRKKTDNKKIIFYFGKIRGTKGLVSEKLRLLAENFQDVKIFTRTFPDNKAELIKEISGANLLVTFDPMTSLIHETIMLGTPCLIMDDIFLKEYKSFNIPIHDIYFNSDIDYLYEKVVRNETIPNHKEENIQVFNKALKCQEKNVIEILLLANNHFFSSGKENFKKNIIKNKVEDKNFHKFYTGKWGSNPIFNVTTKKSLIYYYLFYDNFYLYHMLLNIYLNLKTRKYFSALRIFKLNIFKIVLNIRLFYFVKFIFTSFILRRKNTDRDLINFLKEMSDVFSH